MLTILGLMSGTLQHQTITIITCVAAIDISNMIVGYAIRSLRR